MLAGVFLRFSSRSSAIYLLNYLDAFADFYVTCLAGVTFSWRSWTATLSSSSFTMEGGRQQLAQSVPGWDGNPRGWRRYSRAVTWFVLGTKKASRPFLAPRLISNQVDWPSTATCYVMESARLQRYSRSTASSTEAVRISFGQEKPP